MSDIRELRERIVRELGWRVEEETARYIAGRIEGASREPFPIFANDARTGTAIRPMFDPNRWSRQNATARIS